jgi:hypothetical protein
VDLPPGPGNCSGAEAGSLDPHKSCARLQVGAEFLKKTLVQYKPNNPDFYVIYQVRTPTCSALNFQSWALPLVRHTALCLVICLALAATASPYVCHPTPLGAGPSHAAPRACQLCSATNTTSLLLHYRSAT